MDASRLLFSSLLILHRLLVRHAVRWRSMGEELLEQIGVVPLSDVRVTPVIELLVSILTQLPRSPLRPLFPGARKAGYILDPVDEGDLPRG